MKDYRVNRCCVFTLFRCRVDLYREQYNIISLYQDTVQRGIEYISKRNF